MFAAHITAHLSQLSATSGSPLRLDATVRNTSGREWRADDASRTKYPFRLGNHWLTHDGAMKQINDTRTELTNDLKPGEEVSLPITVTAPVEPGHYLLELDMVQEHVAWFKNKGSSIYRIPVHVTVASHDVLPPQAIPVPTAPDMTPPEMAVPRLNTDSVAAEGATLLSV